MHDCDNNDCIGFDPIINAKGKAMNQRASRMPVNDLINQWCFRNRGEGCKDLIQKLVAQP